MQPWNRILLLLALCLSLLRSVSSLAVSVTQISCTRLYFSVTLTTAEIAGATNLGILIDGDIVSEVGLSGSFTTTNTAAFYAAFFNDITSGTYPVTFALLDEDDATLAAFTPVVQTLTFQCGTVITSTTSSRATPTSGGSSGSGSNGSGSNSGGNSSNASSSSGSSSSTGAIAGGVAGGVAALAIVGLVAFCLMRKKKKQQRSQGRLHNEADEAAFRGPNNDSTTSLATAPEHAETPMMRDISTKNVFADPTTSGASGSGGSGSSNQGSGASAGTGTGIGAAAAGGIGAAAIAARKQSRERSRARSPSLHSERRPSTDSSSKGPRSPDSEVPPPVPALPASAAMAARASPSVEQSSAPPAAQPQQSARSRTELNNDSAVAAGAVGAGAGAGATAAAGIASPKAKTSKWGFKRASKDQDEFASNNAIPAASAPNKSQSATPADTMSLASTTPSQKSAHGTESPARSFKVIQKSSPAPVSMAGPSNASITPSEGSGRRMHGTPRSGYPTPAGSIRSGNAYSLAPSVASMSAGFGNMAGVGAGRAYGMSSGNSTKWHQQAYQVMPNFSSRAMPRSTQLDEDLIFGHLGMGLSPPPGATGNGSETGSSKSRQDPFGDR
ncbi:hypothetical protein BCV70DRAFT_38501 [Testicularia cyperi]|uniref:Uncharacterized protein n=1 Tax=Testicularia cyperi TaxID=1882483 RepID=A0A317XJ80_9BASI|nr:hypothetical protein BCV70DRAFT_38501 [Testicularia cyperi]